MYSPCNAGYTLLLGENMKILIVDDDEISLDMLKFILGLDKHEVRAFGCPFEAVECLKQEKFDLIISDYMMPKMSGLLFIKAIKHYIGETKIAFLSAYTFSKLGLKKEDYADEIGRIDKVFYKPLDIAQLNEYIIKINRHA